MILHSLSLGLVQWPQSMHVFVKAKINSNCTNEAYLGILILDSREA